MHQLTDEQLATIITWAKKTRDVELVFLCGIQAKSTAEPDSVELALSVTSQDSVRRLATFISHRRAWRAEQREGYIYLYLDPPFRQRGGGRYGRSFNKTNPGSVRDDPGNGTGTRVPESHHGKAPGVWVLLWD
jgi:hypothetical protein